MVKTTTLPLLAANAVDGSENIVAVKNGIAYRSRTDALLAPFVDAAQNAATMAEAATGPGYETVAEGLAQTDPDEGFAVVTAGLVTVYEHQGDGSALPLRTFRTADFYRSNESVWVEEHYPLYPDTLAGRTAAWQAAADAAYAAGHNTIDCGPREHVKGTTYFAHTRFRVRCRAMRTNGNQAMGVCVIRAGAPGTNLFEPKPGNEVFAGIEFVDVTCAGYDENDTTSNGVYVPDTWPIAYNLRFDNFKMLYGNWGVWWPRSFQVELNNPDGYHCAGGVVRCGGVSTVLRNPCAGTNRDDLAAATITGMEAVTVGGVKYLRVHFNATAGMQLVNGCFAEIKGISAGGPTGYNDRPFIVRNVADTSVDLQRIDAAATLAATPWAAGGQIMRSARQYWLTGRPTILSVDNASDYSGPTGAHFLIGLSPSLNDRNDGTYKGSYATFIGGQFESMRTAAVEFAATSSGAVRHPHIVNSTVNMPHLFWFERLTGNFVLDTPTMKDRWVNNTRGDTFPEYGTTDEAIASGEVVEGGYFFVNTDGVLTFYQIVGGMAVAQANPAAVGTFDTTAAGVAGSINGDFFYVRNQWGGLSLYKNVGGVAQLFGNSPVRGNTLAHVHVASCDATKARIIYTPGQFGTDLVVTGNPPTVLDLVKAAERVLGTRDAARIRKTAALAVASGVETAIGAVQALRNDNGIVDPATGRITIKTTGWHDFLGKLAFSPGVDQARYEVRWKVNGTTVEYSGQNQSGTSTVYIDINLSLYLTAGDTVDPYLFYSGGGSANILTGVQSTFTVKYSG